MLSTEQTGYPLWCHTLGGVMNLSAMGRQAAAMSAHPHASAPLSAPAGAAVMACLGLAFTLYPTLSWHQVCYGTGTLLLRCGSGLVGESRC